MNELLINIIAASVDTDNMISIMLMTMIIIVFIATWAINRISILRIRQTTRQSQELSAIMQHALDITKNYVVRLDYQGKRAYNLHGNMLPDNGMGYEDCLNNIHPEDRHIFTEFITKLFKENVPKADCIFRWDMSRGQHLEDWRYIHDLGVAYYSKENDQQPVNIFCTITDVTEQIHAEQEEKEMTGKYKKMFEQSIIGLAFYDKEGYLITANQKMREILKFQSEKDPFYFEHTVYEMPCLRGVLNQKREEEFFFCTQSVIAERGVYCYTEMRIHPVRDQHGQLQFITVSLRDVTQERELYLQNKANDLAIRRANEEIQEYKNELEYMMDACTMRFFRISNDDRICIFYETIKEPEVRMDLEEIIDHFLDSPFKQGLREYETYFNVQRTDLTHMRPFFRKSEELQWNYIDSVPSFDSEGRFMGTYGVVRNVTPLIEKQEQLRRETERAKQSGIMKSSFMANMTHEIRTPLNAIVGFSDVLPMLSTPEDKKEIIHVIMNNCDMLLRLINDMLAVSEVGERGLHIQPIDTDFAHDFNDICKSLAQRVQMPGVEFITENPYPALHTTLDRERITQVITNFVTNAVKYTHQGYIKVGYEYREDDGGGLYIYCSDTGAGIKKEDQAKVFERFVKLNDFVQGTGLGLNITKAIVESCQGKIGVDSEGEGKGSTFWVWIPCPRKETSDQTS